MGMASGAQPPDGWSASKPWGALMTMLLRDEHFWQEQLHQPALTWMARGMRGIPKSPMEAYMEDVPTPTAEGTKEAAKTKKEARKRKRTADREELKRLRAAATGSKQDGGKGGGKADGKGNQRCFGWNNGNGPCAGLSPGSPCQAKVPSAPFAGLRATQARTARRRRRSDGPGAAMDPRTTRRKSWEERGPKAQTTRRRWRRTRRRRRRRGPHRGSGRHHRGGVQA